MRGTNLFFGLIAVLTPIFLEVAILAP